MKTELPNITVLAFLLILGLFLNIITVSTDNVPNFLLENSELAQYRLRTKLLMFGVLFLKSILNVFIAIWLFSKARSQNEKAITWATLGLFFGVFAIILFYLIILTKEIKLLNSNFKKNN